MQKSIKDKKDKEREKKDKKQEQAENEKEEDNSMYVNEIYSCNFNADLTVLTACESGRPGFQDGEGMISLAHAFYYAGSKRILTGLRKIDERASAQMMEYFYTNLSEGQPKDEALRNAKLKYLTTSEGRMLAPQYWAGLVIMGDTSPIAIAPKSNYKILAIAIMAMLAAFGIFLLRKKSRERKTFRQATLTANYNGHTKNRT